MINIYLLEQQQHQLSIVWAPRFSITIKIYKLSHKGNNLLKLLPLSDNDINYIYKNITGSL